MDFSLGEERQMLADSLGRFLEREYGIEKRHSVASSGDGYDRQAWQALAELGMIGALFNEEAGGFGGSGFDIGVVFEKLGPALVLEPFLPTLMAGTVLASCGRHDLLAQVIEATTTLAMATQEGDGGYDPTLISTHAKGSEPGWTLTGAKAVAQAAGQADTAVVSASLDGEQALFLLPLDAPGVTVRDYPTIDGLHAGDITIEDARLPAEALLARGPDSAAVLERAHAAGVIGVVHEAVGLMDSIKADTLDYLRTRKQFGVPIGRFQALQHRMANVALEIEQARSAAINAAAALSAVRQQRERAISAAKYTIGRVGALVAEEAIQMHGGIGMTWELPLSHKCKRLVMIDHMLGDEDYHLARFIALAEEAAV